MFFEMFRARFGIRLSIGRVFRLLHPFGRQGRDRARPRPDIGRLPPYLRRDIGLDR